jgi:hypothetical protein
VETMTAAASGQGECGTQQKGRSEKLIDVHELNFL